MAPPRKLVKLPKEIQEELKERMISSGYSDYEGHSEWLRERIKEYVEKLEQEIAVAKANNDLETYLKLLQKQDRIEEVNGGISKSVLHKYGNDYKKYLRNIGIATEAAQLVPKDEEGALMSATIGAVQTEAFNFMVDFQNVVETKDPVKRVKLLGNIAHAVADVSRASLKQKEWANKVRERTEAAAAAVEKITRKGGLSAESAEAIRREILGIAA